MSGRGQGGVNFVAGLLPALPCSLASSPRPILNNSSVTTTRR